MAGVPLTTDGLSPSPRERLLTALAGGRPATLSVAPLYMSLYLARPWHEATARIWREQAEAAGGTLGVTYEEYLCVEREVWLESHGVFRHPPDWLWAPSVSGPGVEGAAVEVTDEGCFWVTGPGERMQLDGPFSDAAAPVWESEDPPDSVEEVKRRLPTPTAEELAPSYELTRRMLHEVGETWALFGHVSAPFPAAYGQLGFHGLMIAMREHPELVTAIAERRLGACIAQGQAAREAGLEVIFIEEWACGADLISPEHYLRFAWPFERDLCRELKHLGLKTVFYFCGSIQDRLDRLVQLDADALAFEESKKDWTVDIGEVRSRVAPSRCLFGNVDVVLARDAGSEDLRAEVRRQIDAAGPAAFVTSLGSPLTLDTAPGRVDRLMEAARDYG